MNTFRVPLTFALSVLLFASDDVAADDFGSGDTEFQIEFVTIGNPGNPRDPMADAGPGGGTVNYVYRIGKYEISRGAIEKANAAGGLGITLADMSDFGGNSPNKPATGVSVVEIATFVNWLNSTSGYPDAYQIWEGGSGLKPWAPSDPGYDPNNTLRNAFARYFMPSSDEWYKAAYFDPQTDYYFYFATGTDFPEIPAPVASGTEMNTAVYHQDVDAGPAEITQAGGSSPYGTVAQGGNVLEIEETIWDPDAGHGVRGGYWAETDVLWIGQDPRGGIWHESQFVGFRVASIPEPSSQLLVFSAVLAVFLQRRWSNTVR